jgi:hypothetical protein
MPETPPRDTRSLNVTTLLFHPGHGATDASPLVHHLAEPVHAIALAMAVLGAALVVWMLARRRARAD